MNPLNGSLAEEPYLEIMVSEQGFDDVGEIEGEAVSRGDAGKLLCFYKNLSLRIVAYEEPHAAVPRHPHTAM